MARWYGDPLWEAQPDATQPVIDKDVPDLLRGRTVLRVAFEADTDDWDGSNCLLLELDNGTVVTIAPWGYDAWGADVSTT